MIFFIIFLKYFLLYIKVSKNVSASYDQENKERLPKKKRKKKNLVKVIKVFHKNKKKESNNMVVKNTKIYQKMKRKSLLSVEKNIIESKNAL